MAEIKQTKTNHLMLRCDFCKILIFANGPLSQTWLTNLSFYSLFYNAIIKSKPSHECVSSKLKDNIIGKIILSTFSEFWLSKESDAKFSYKRIDSNDILSRQVSQIVNSEDG